MNEKLKEKFLNEFPIIKGKKQNPYIILIDGLTGMGKSTVSLEISKYDHSVILNNDEVRNFLKDYEDKSNIRNELQLFRLTELLKNNNSCIMDSCFCHNYQKKLEIYKKLGYPYYIIRLECSDKTVKNRLDARTLDGVNYSTANYDDYLWMKNNVTRVPIELVDFTIDTEDDIKSQIQLFLKKFNLKDN